MNSYVSHHRSRTARIANLFALLCLALAAVFGIDVAVRTYVFGQHSSASTQQKPAPRTVALREDDLVIRTVTESGVKFERTYRVDFDGKLVNVGMPTPYINSGDHDDNTTATINSLCTAAFKVNTDSRTDHLDRDTKVLVDDCNAATAALDHGNIKKCKNSLIDMGGSIVSRVNDVHVLDNAFTNGNINDACGDKKGSSKAADSGTYYVPAIAAIDGM